MSVIRIKYFPENEAVSTEATLGTWNFVEGSEPESWTNSETSEPFFSKSLQEVLEEEKAQVAADG